MSDLIEVPESNMQIMREPGVVLIEAKTAAQALMTVISQKKKPVIINNEQYLEFEDLQILAKFYGVSVKVSRTNFIDFGGVKGYEAFAEAISVTNGMVLSSADAMCLNDEEKWSTRPKFEYVNGQKVKAGDVAVPLFQLRSMAQTRACAKTLRNILGWVVVLAGYRPTPAEEMTGNEQSFLLKPSGKPAVMSPQEIKQNGSTNLITEPQAKRLYAIVKGAGYPEKDFEEWLFFNYNIESTRQIDKKNYEAICTHAQGWKPNA